MVGNNAITESITTILANCGNNRDLVYFYKFARNDRAVSSPIRFTFNRFDSEFNKRSPFSLIGESRSKRKKKNKMDG